MSPRMVTASAMGAGGLVTLDTRVPQDRAQGSVFQCSSEHRTARCSRDPAPSVLHPGNKAGFQLICKDTVHRFFHSIQGQVGWSSEQPGLVEDAPAHGRRVGTR